ncbi:MAG: hypothetical protein JNL58_00155 [Planctomyces sp.]|nr:hypothetical protein [Planctomyces sp.]
MDRAGFQFKGSWPPPGYRQYLSQPSEVLIVQYLKLMLVIGVTVLAGCTGGEPTPSSAPTQYQELIMSEGNSTSDALSISNGNVVVKANQPGVAFATVTPPGQSRRIAYFLVFNHDPSNSGVKTEGESTRASAQTFHTISTYGHESTVKYEVVLKSGTESIETESITLNGEAIDSSKGRLLLIDMKHDPPGVSQFNVDLPTELRELKEPDDTEQFSQNTLNEIRKAEMIVDAFCQAIEAQGK